MVSSMKNLSNNDDRSQNQETITIWYINQSGNVYQQLEKPNKCSQLYQYTSESIETKCNGSLEGRCPIHHTKSASKLLSFFLSNFLLDY